LHVEYDEESFTGRLGTGKSIGYPGHLELMKLYSTVSSRFPGKVKILPNNPKALKELSPTKNYREGSFEIVDAKSGELLYSKLQTGYDLVYDEAYFNKFMDGLVEPSPPHKDSRYERAKMRRRKERPPRYQRTLSPPQSAGHSIPSHL